MLEFVTHVPPALQSLHVGELLTLVTLLGTFVAAFIIRIAQLAPKRRKPFLLVVAGSMALLVVGFLGFHICSGVVLNVWSLAFDITVMAFASLHLADLVLHRAKRSLNRR